MRRFSSESRMPSHEIRKGFDLARRFHDAYTSHRSSHLCQFAGHCEDQIGLSDGKDCRYEVWKTEHDTPFLAKLRQRTIRESLLTFCRFNQCVPKSVDTVSTSTDGREPAERNPRDKQSPGRKALRSPGQEVLLLHREPYRF